MESALGFMHAYLQGALLDLPIPGRMGSETMGMYPMGAFDTLDGQSCLVQVSNDIQWKRFCKLLEATELLEDPRFESNQLRVKNRDLLRPLVQAYLIQKTAPEWETLLLDVGVPASHVKPVEMVVMNEQVKARKMVKSTRLASGREIPTWGLPIKADEDMDSRILSVPKRDQHREEILSEIK
jgi:crotonobetainyl-CoA:carnitine CoA-transferase CaiB-like acyl-CoA transferase